MCLAIHAWARGVVAQPSLKHVDPRTVADAYGNTPYVIATGLKHDEVGVLLSVGDRAERSH